MVSSLETTSAVGQAGNGPPLSSSARTQSNLIRTSSSTVSHRYCVHALKTTSARNTRNACTLSFVVMNHNAGIARRAVMLGLIMVLGPITNAPAKALKIT